HLNLWLPYIKKNGLLVIELHTLNPELTSQHLGETASTAYDATHGFSDQYIVEEDVIHKICNEVVLTLDKDLFKKYPDSDLATVSINLLKAYTEKAKTEIFAFFVLCGNALSYFARNLSLIFSIFCLAESSRIRLALMCILSGIRLSKCSVPSHDTFLINAKASVLLAESAAKNSSSFASISAIVGETEW